MAGSICPEPIMRSVHDVMGINKLSVCYGMTETSPVSF
jgi:fatty-acyl-CoA synthase